LREEAVPQDKIARNLQPISAESRYQASGEGKQRESSVIGLDLLYEPAIFQEQAPCNVAGCQIELAQDPGSAEQYARFVNGSLVITTQSQESHEIGSNRIILAPFCGSSFVEFALVPVTAGLDQQSFGRHLPTEIGEGAAPRSLCLASSSKSLEDGMLALSLSRP
jgi:hypothetical protein